MARFTGSPCCQSRGATRHLYDLGVELEYKMSHEATADSGEGEGEGDAAFDWEAMGPYDAVPMEAGDVLIYDNFMPHRSAKNATNAPRRALFAVYNATRHGDLYEAYYASEAAGRRARGTAATGGKANIFFTGKPVLRDPEGVAEAERVD